MRFRKLAIGILLVCAALGAIPAAAFATATATKAQWYTGTTLESVAPLTSPQAATVELGENPTIGKAFKFNINLYEGFPITVVAHQVSCAACELINQNGGRTGVAFMTGKLTFSELAVLSPPNCGIAGGKISTRALLFEADYMEGERALAEVAPVSGEEVFPLELIEPVRGQTCLYASGSHPVKGATFAELNKTGTFAAEDPLSSSPAISTAAGSSWMYGTRKVETTGTLKLKAGGKYFGAK